MREDLIKHPLFRTPPEGHAFGLCLVKADAAWANLTKQLDGMEPYLERTDAIAEWTTRQVLAHLLFEPGWTLVDYLRKFSEHELPPSEIIPSVFTRTDERGRANHSRCRSPRRGEMSTRRAVLAAVGYIVVTFVIAATWHLLLFKSVYDVLAIFTREDPSSRSACCRCWYRAWCSPASTRVVREAATPLSRD